MKLIVKADDFGMSDAISCGIIKGIKDGIITCTGLMTTFPSSEQAAKMIMKEFPDFCLGMDICLVAGRPTSDPVKVPHLVNENGEFISSVERRKAENWPDVDPYPYEEVRCEIHNQVEEFIRLVGKKPYYITGHSITTDNIKKAIHDVCEEYGILNVSRGAQANEDLHRIQGSWNKKPFPLQDQMEADAENYVLSHIDELLPYEYGLLSGHPGFVDEDMFDRTTYTMIRTKDLSMMLSNKLKEWIKEHKVELVDLREFAKNKGVLY